MNLPILWSEVEYEEEKVYGRVLEDDERVHPLHATRAT
jgi:hypothetical protein